MENYIGKGKEKLSLCVDPKAQALIFDIDGTLANNMPVHYQSWLRVVTDLGGSFPEDLFYKWAGIPTYQITEMLNEKFKSTMMPDEAVKLKEKYFLEMLTEVSPIQPVVDIVLNYSGKLPMACGTGGRKAIAELILNNLNLYNYFEIIVAAEDVSKHKPDPETFLKCADFLGVEPQYCQVFEDGNLGMEAAITGGMMVTDVRPFV